MPFELVDTSLQGEVYGRSNEQTERLETTTRYIDQWIAKSPQFRLVDRKPIADLLTRYQDQYAHVYRCSNCAVDAAKAASADLVLVGWVQKVSNLILNMNIRLYSAADGKVQQTDWVSLRGNNDEMWQRAAERLLADAFAASASTPSAPTAGSDER